MTARRISDEEISMSQGPCDQVIDALERERALSAQLAEALRGPGFARDYVPNAQGCSGARWASHAT